MENEDLKPQVSATQIEKEYEEGLQYKKQMGFTDKWPEYERFKAGDQWPAATEKTKHLPRPVFNIIEYIQNHKVSSVMNENVKMIFTPQESFDEEQAKADEEIAKAIEGADLFTRYSDTSWENIKQDELNEEALESAANIGTGIWHYYWDNSKKGGIKVPYVGEIAGETIDSMNIFFGNPQNRYVQKQPYIIISNRDTVKNVRKEAENNGVSKELVLQITSDKKTTEEGYDSAKHEINGSEKTTVLTKYWKEYQVPEVGAKVYFAKVCSGVVVKPATDSGLTLYPIVIMQWKRRKKSIFGIGDTEGLIPNQKGINFLMAMQLLSVQLTGWPKLVYKTGAVDPSKINNDPSVPIEDRSAPGQEGVRYLNPGTSTYQAEKLLDSFMENTKMLSSAHDVSTGDIGKGDMNASAIMLLQKAAGVPIESIKKRFYMAMEDVARIWEDFWKSKYNTQRNISVKDDDGEEYAADFTGTDYADVPMNLKIDIGPSSSYSEELMMASLDKLYDKQAITIEDYLEFAPKNVVPFKDRLLKKLQERQEQMMQQERMMMEQQSMMGGQVPGQMPQDDLGPMLDKIRQASPEAAQMDDEQLLALLGNMQPQG